MNFMIWFDIFIVSCIVIYLIALIITCIESG